MTRRQVSPWVLLSLAVRALAQEAVPAAGSPAAIPGPSAALREALAKQRAAMEVQREAARKQAELLRLEPLVHSITGESADQAPEWDCDPIPDETVGPLIEGAAKTNELQPDLLRAVIRQESQFHPCAISEKGAQGLMQLMPATSQELGVKDAFDPKQSIDAGAKYLKQLFEKYKGKLELVLGAYNAGPSTVDEAQGIPDIPETRNYVQAILEGLSKKAP